MQHWDLTTLGVEPRHPQILQSKRGEGRAIAIHLPAGESLQDHEVHERAYLTVVEGEVEVDAGETVSAGPGALFVFDPKNATRSARPPTPACCSCSPRGRGTATRAAATEREDLPALGDGNGAGWGGG